jgi:hypothetical protein
MLPLLGGMFIGSSMAGGNRYQQQPTVVYQQMPPQQPSNAELQARIDAESARRSAEQAALAAAQAQQAAQTRQAVQAQPDDGSKPNLLLVKVRIPNGVYPGQSFTFKVNNRAYAMNCPSSATQGQEILAYVSVEQQEVATRPVAQATETRSELAEVGRTVLRDAFEGASAPPMSSLQPTAVLQKDHVVDEQALQNVEHGIVSGKQGDIVKIIEGTVEGGMAPPYGEYCTVCFGNGKVGKVSRFILRPYNESSPPRALT